jgi:hypothetical protein
LGAGFREVPGFIDVHGKIHPDPIRHLEEKIGKEGARGSAADHGDTGTVIEEQPLLFGSRGRRTGWTGTHGAVPPEPGLQGYFDFLPGLIVSQEWKGGNSNHPGQGTAGGANPASLREQAGHKAGSDIAGGPSDEDRPVIRHPSSEGVYYIIFGFPDITDEPVG